MYPVTERPSEVARRAANIVNQRPSRRNSAAASARGTPERPTERPVERPVERPPERSPEAREVREVREAREANPPRHPGNEIAATIQHIKEQMAEMNVKDGEGRRDGERGGRRDEWRRRNSGNGILGNYPANNHFNGRVVA